MSAHSQPGLRELSQVVLPAAQERWLQRLARSEPVRTAWSLRKHAEARSLLALAQLAPWRLQVEYLDLSDDLRAQVRMRVAVPLRTPPGAELRTAQEALLALVLPAEILRGPVPGTSVACVLSPRDVFHPTVLAREGLPQALCLGPAVPANTPLREIVLWTYAALSLQIVELDPRAPQGVLNAVAAEWFQHNRALIPLTRRPFLARDEVVP